MTCLRDIAVIIPLGPGETEAAGLLAQLTALPAEAEVFVVHAGPAFPNAWLGAVRLVEVTHAGGRAAQMNAAAARVGRRWLWFLHADSCLGPGWFAALDAFLRRDEAALGWFGLTFRDDGPWLTRTNAWGANARSRWLGLPFGDQGLVLPAARFAALGGYDESAVNGEDHLLVWAARRSGLRLRRIDARIATSARRYARNGWAATTARHLRLTAVQAVAGAFPGVIRRASKTPAPARRY